MQCAAGFYGEYGVRRLVYRSSLCLSVSSFCDVDRGRRQADVRAQWAVVVVVVVVVVVRCTRKRGSITTGSAEAGLAVDISGTGFAVATHVAAWSRTRLSDCLRVWVQLWCLLAVSDAVFL